jgi:hypothetical protein
MEGVSGHEPGCERRAAYMEIDVCATQALFGFPATCHRLKTGCRISPAPLDDGGLEGAKYRTLASFSS